MKRFLLTSAAEADLEEISDFIRRRDSAQAAKNVRSTLRRAMERLAATPGMGHVREDPAGDDVRFWPVYSYLILYLADTRLLQVLRVLHGARDVAAILDEEGA